MTPDDIAGLCERLRAVESSGHGGVTTNWHRNPDGPEAANTLERQAAEIERLRDALWPFANAKPTSAKGFVNICALNVDVIAARAALTGEDTATLSLSDKTQTDARTRGDECTS
jgi:hypothetical protein